jgi:phosphoribosyl 1,2-cyclic phosphate phosphodiesterase
MKIIFLGTGTSQGVPVIACHCEVCSSKNPKDNRLRTSIFVQTDTAHFIIDTGPDFRQQMLREDIQRLDAVVFTHAHKDHTAGMDDIRAFNFKENKDMPLFAQKIVVEQLQREFEYIFSGKKYPGIPSVQTTEIHTEPFFINDLQIIPIEVMHYKLPVLGYRIGNFTYITDVNFVSDTEKAKIMGTEILVIGALQREPHISHFNLQQALDFIKLIQPKQAYLTHISHKMGLHNDVSLELPSNVALAYDGLVLEM